jgi:hypothetical protein
LLFSRKIQPEIHIISEFAFPFKSVSQKPKVAWIVNPIGAAQAIAKERAQKENHWQRAVAGFSGDEVGLREFK